MSLDLPDVVFKKKFSICAFCDTKVDYQTLYNESLKTIDILEFRIEQMHLKDSCYNKIYENDKKPITRLVEIPMKIHWPLNRKVYMVTLTFDPKKFKVLINRTAQRSYIRMIVDEYIELFTPDYLYGCYELHDSGVVHSHFIISNFSDDELNWFKKKFTDNPKNDTAVHRCEKDKLDAIEYLNKVETKDTNNMQNYYVYQDMEEWPAWRNDETKPLPTQEELYEKFKKINNYII